MSMLKDMRQSSFSREKTHNHQQHPPNTHKVKNNTNPPTHQQQISKELIRKSEGQQSYLPLYRVTKTKFEKTNLRYSDNSPFKSKEKISRMSPYRQQQFEAYNFGHLGPLDHFERKKKGRNYFYKRNEDNREEAEAQKSKIDQLKPIIEIIKQPPPETVQLEKTTEEISKEEELIVEELHYAMVRTYQNCKNNHNF